jgi:hypothetical protein
MLATARESADGSGSTTPQGSHHRAAFGPSLATKFSGRNFANFPLFPNNHWQIATSLLRRQVHLTKMGTAHGTKVGGLRGFLRQRLTKLLPIIFARYLRGPDRLCRLIPVDSIHHGLE